MAAVDPKAALHQNLQTARDAVRWKLEGLSEYDVRRPLVPTGTNLLGLIKHLAAVELGYFGDTFDRPFAGTPSWYALLDDEPMRDMYATADETREEILDLYEQVCAHADETITALPLTAPGSVPWWPEQHRDVTLLQIVTRVVGETNRHAGHADILRELIDGAVGLRRDNGNMPSGDAGWWEDYRRQLNEIAERAR